MAGESLGTAQPVVGGTVVLTAQNLQQLFDALKDRSYSLVGPTVQDGAIVYAEIDSIDDLPLGWSDEQDGGTYRLKQRGDDARFGYAVGPHSWKKYLQPPIVRLWRARRRPDGFDFDQEKLEPSKYAFIGVRSCELHAIGIQDRVLLRGTFSDPVYGQRRENLFLIAVNCAQAGGTCFCVSMETGPKASSGFDLALTEILHEKQRLYVTEVGTERGSGVLAGIPYGEAHAPLLQEAVRVVDKTAGEMGRQLDTRGIKELLYRNTESPRWDQVAARCLSCANCTMVCPTCFCTTVEDVTDLTGDNAERWRKWDSCFTTEFSYIHGGSVRSTVKSRYRQWLTHKLATWIDQFGSSGCVGCGRCITWCPVGIDITEEMHTIRSDDESSGSVKGKR